MRVAKEVWYLQFDLTLPQGTLQSLQLRPDLCSTCDVALFPCLLYPHLHPRGPYDMNPVPFAEEETTQTPAPTCTPVT